MWTLRSECRITRANPSTPSPCRKVQGGRDPLRCLKTNIKHLSRRILCKTPLPTFWLFSRSARDYLYSSFQLTVNWLCLVRYMYTAITLFFCRIEPYILFFLIKDLLDLNDLIRYVIYQLKLTIPLTLSLSF